MATAEQNHEVSLPIISTITKEEYLQPSGTPEEIISDAKRVNKLLETDGETLIHAGIAPEFITELPVRIDTFLIAAVNQETAVDKKDQITIDWKAGEKRGYDLRGILAHHYLFLYRKNPALKAEVTEIMKGVGPSDMVLDLKRLVVLGRNNPAELETAPLFDMNLIDEADALHIELSVLHAAYEAAPKEEKTLYTLKRQAFTWLETAMNEIREFGQYVFHNNEEKKAQYKRDYR